MRLEVRSTDPGWRVPLVKALQNADHRLGVSLDLRPRIYVG